MPVSALNSETSTNPWVHFAPSPAGPWNLARVVHLHRRAGFAATWAEIERDLREGPELSVTRLLKGNAHLDGTLKDFESVSAALAESAASTSTADRLKAWWVFRMLFSPDPLGERLALMWHNHFATSNLKVSDLGAMRRQNDIFREFARAPFGELLRRAIKDPALLDWLDAPANRREHPNENLARESMELFTIGVGNFTEKDVKEAARALTGWSYKPDGFREFPQYHDDGEKKILGRKGRFRGDDFVAILLEQPATSVRLARRLCDLLMGEAPSVPSPPGATQNTEALVASLAAGLREHQLDIGWGVERILRSQVFFAADNLKTRVLAPPEFAVGAARTLQIFDPPPSTLLLAEWIGRMGQDSVLSAQRLRLAGRTIVAQLANAGRADQFRLGTCRGERALSDGTLQHPGTRREGRRPPRRGNGDPVSVTTRVGERSVARIGERPARRGGSVGESHGRGSPPRGSPFTRFAGGTVGMNDRNWSARVALAARPPVERARRPAKNTGGRAASATHS